MSKINFEFWSFSKLVVCCVIYFIFDSSLSIACDPNDPLPSALPPAPNGGIVAEAKEPMLEGNDKSDEKTDHNDQIYWEGVYDNYKKIIVLNLLMIIPPKTAVFTPLFIENHLSNISIKVERPREGRTEKVSYRIEKGKIIINYDSSDGSRFIVHVSANHMNRIKKSQIQIEED